MSNIIYQQKIADMVLERIEGFDPSCILAGGAPRDWYFNKEASDLDVFFHFRDGSTLRQIRFLLKKAFPDLHFELRAGMNFNEDDDSEYKKNPHLRRVLQTEIGGIKVQLMEMRKPTWECVVEEFPLSICKIWYKNGKIRTTLEFENCVKHNIIVKTNEIYADGDKYLKKIVGKFPHMKYYPSYEEYFRKFKDSEI